MSTNEAKKLKVDQRVMWAKNPQDLGTVIEVGYNAVKVKWDNGQTGLTHHNDMNLIDGAQPKETP